VLIDCDSCAVRDLACHDCVVTALLGPPGSEAGLEMPEDEWRALDALADGGLVPRLRLVPLGLPATARRDAQPQEFPPRRRTAS
jgi:hypothetical protein